MQPHAQPNQLIIYAITAAVVGVVVALRWRRMRRTVPLRIERLWIFPALYAVIASVLFFEYPPVGWGWAFCAAGLATGAALGWQRGKLMRISVDPATHTLNQTGSPAALVFILVLVVVRSVAKAALGANNGLHLNAMLVTGILISLSIGLFTATRVEMFLRARRLLGDHRAGAALS